MLAYFLHLVAKGLHALAQGTPVDFAERDLHLHDRFDKTGVVNVVRGQRLPFTVMLSHVGDEKVSVQLRIEIARGVVGKGSRHHFAGMHNGSDTVLCGSRGDKLFHIACRHLHGMVMRLHHLLVSANQAQNRDAFGCRKRQVMAGTVHMVAINFPAQARTVRQTAFEHSCQITAPDIALEAQLFCAFTQPETL